MNPARHRPAGVAARRFTATPGNQACLEAPVGFTLVPSLRFVSASFSPCPAKHRLTRSTFLVRPGHRWTTHPGPGQDSVWESGISWVRNLNRSA